MEVFVSVPKKSEVMETFLTEPVRRYLEERFQVRYSPLERNLTPEEESAYAGNARVIITGWGHPMLDAETVEGTGIRLIAHTGGSVGSLVSPEIYRRGIRVISGNRLYADSVAEGVLTYMLAALRRMPDYVDRMRSGGWGEAQDISEGLLDQTVGLVGVGAISLRLMRLLQMFRVKIKVFSRYPVDTEILEKYRAEQVSLEEIFSTCKIVSLHSAMSESTRGMIGREHFDLLQDGALFVNTARGGIVREAEMTEALKEKRFRAVLDVYCQEPPGQDNPLRCLDNVYCMPHQAGPTRDRRALIARQLIDNIVKFRAGEEMELEISREYAGRMTVGG